MKKSRISYDLIKHLEWNPDETLIQYNIKMLSMNTISSSCIEDILGGKVFYDGIMLSALQNALAEVAKSGYIATMPEFITAKAHATIDKIYPRKSHPFWKDSYTVHSEENVGYDSEGKFYDKGTPVLIVVHGGGLLTPKRIKQAYAEEIVGPVTYNSSEISQLLNGKLADGKTISLYSFKQLQAGGIVFPHQFGIVMPYKTAQERRYGCLKQEEFIKNPLVIARTAGVEPEVLSQYFEKAKNSDGGVGNTHCFDGDYISIPRGQLLSVYSMSSGLDGGNDIRYGGRFVGVVAPHNHGTAKK